VKLAMPSRPHDPRAEIQSNEAPHKRGCQCPRALGCGETLECHGPHLLSQYHPHRTITSTGPPPSRCIAAIGVPKFITTPLEEDTNLFVGRLPSVVDELFVYKMFSPFGTISSLHVEADSRTGVPKGYAFVQFLKAADADVAMRTTNNSFVGNNKIRTRPARSKAPGV
jgi:hypothetical protein